jgi:hypothetical protein
MSKRSTPHVPMDFGVFCGTAGSLQQTLAYLHEEDQVVVLSALKEVAIRDQFFELAAGLRESQKVVHLRMKRTELNRKKQKP